MNSCNEFLDKINALDLFKEIENKLSEKDLEDALEWLPCDLKYSCAEQYVDYRFTARITHIKKMIHHNFSCHIQSLEQSRMFKQHLLRFKCNILFENLYKNLTIDEGNILISELKALAEYSPKILEIDLFFRNIDHVDVVYQFLENEMKSQAEKSTPTGEKPIPTEEQSNPTPNNLYDEVISTLCTHYVAEMEKAISIRMLHQKKVSFLFAIENSGIRVYLINYIQNASNGRLEATNFDSNHIEIKVASKKVN